VDKILAAKQISSGIPAGVSSRSNDASTTLKLEKEIYHYNLTEKVIKIIEGGK
jgi:hypothetical protein